MFGAGKLSVVGLHQFSRSINLNSRRGDLCQEAAELRIKSETGMLVLANRSGLCPRVICTSVNTFSLNSRNAMSSGHRFVL